MRINFRQGIVSHQSGGFLQVSGNVVSILADNAPVLLTVAHRNTNYTHSEDLSVNAAWQGPFTEQHYWLYWDFNQLTFERTFGKTTLEPVAQSVEPGSGNAPIVGIVPGDAGSGVPAFVVDGHYVLQTGRTIAVVNSSSRNGNYTVENIAYNTATGFTTIFVQEEVLAGTIDGEIALDIDSYGNPLYTEGRHWFDTKNNKHYVLTNGVWQEVLRVFSAHLLNGNQLLSVSQNATSGDFTGTQIGNNSSGFSGRVLFGESSKPIRRDDGTFFTTEDQFFTNQSRVDALRLEANVARAQLTDAAAAAFTVVAWDDENKIRTAQYDDVGNTVVGMLTEDLTYNNVGAVIIQGVITNPAWNFTGGSTPIPVGAPLWVLNGGLAATDPHELDPITYPVGRVPVARVLSRDTIIFEQGLGGKGDQGPPGSIDNIPPATPSSIGGVTLVTDSSDPTRALVISDTDPRLSDARYPLAHTHNASDITFISSGGILSSNVQDALTELGNGKLNISGGTMTGQLFLNSDPVDNLEAATKRYVDNLVNGLVWLEPIHAVNLIGDNLLDPPSSPQNGDIYIIPAGTPTGAWAGRSENDMMQWNDGSGAWIFVGNLNTISHPGTLRLGISMVSSTTATGTFAGRDNEIAIFDSTGNLVGFETPVTNNAVYVDSDASLFAYDQYVFNGTEWIKFGGSTTPFVGDGITIDVSSSGIVSAIPAVSGGQIDALTLDGNDLAALDLRWAPFTHTHISTDITFVPYGGNGEWGNAVNPDSGQIVASTVDGAIKEIADRKAEKTPLYATTADLPSSTNNEGMLAVVDADNTVYFADDAGWTPLARGDHTHRIPYDISFYVHNPLRPNENIASFAITRSVTVSAGAPDSFAFVAKPATSGPTVIEITRVASPYTSPVLVGSITFNISSYTGVISWSSDVTFNAGDVVMLRTDASPTEAEQIAVTLVGCSTANSC